MTDTLIDLTCASTTPPGGVSATTGAVGSCGGASLCADLGLGFGFGFGLASAQVHGGGEVASVRTLSFDSVAPLSVGCDGGGASVAAVCGGFAAAGGCSAARILLQAANVAIEINDAPMRARSLIRFTATAPLHVLDDLGHRFDQETRTT